MNTLEFYEEVKSSKICPERFDEIFTEFSDYQKLAINTLKEFHRVCEQNNIPYQLAFGSLLGAIRDNGQIPWDYDIDVIIPYQERFRLVEALKEDLSEDFYFYCPETNDDCRHYFMRVTPKGYKSTKFHVDVFYVIGSYDDESDRLKHEQEMNKYFHLRYVKLVKYSDLGKRAKIKISLERIRSAGTSLKVVNKRLDEICSRIPVSESNFCIPVFEVYHHKYFETKKLWDTRLINTDNGEFRITSYYDEILKSIYKDYTKIFPLEYRLNEMLSSYMNLSGKKVNLVDVEPTNGRYYNT